MIILSYVTAINILHMNLSRIMYNMKLQIAPEKALSMETRRHTGSDSINQNQLYYWSKPAVN